MTRKIVKPEVARSEWLCPVARLWGDSTTVQARCRGDDCPVWRWKPLMATDPDYAAAVKKVMQEQFEGKAVGHKAAVAYVQDNLKELGLPERPFEGWCGLGGSPLKFGVTR